MKKIAFWTIIASFCLLINKSAFAYQNDFPPPQFLIINSQQVPIMFDATSKAKLDVPVDSANKILVIELPASEKWNLLVPDCNNQILRPGQRIACALLPENTQLTFVRSWISPPDTFEKINYIGITVILILLMSGITGGICI